MTVEHATGIAVAQFAPVADTSVNVATIDRLARVAVSRGARLVVFPEYSSFFEPELGPASLAAAQPLAGEFVARLSTLASALGIHIVAGMLESADDGSRVSNTLVALGPDGSLEATYRKLHLYDAFGAKESALVVPGEITEPQTFALGDLTVGLQTCYDLRFPEVTRRIVDAGADVVLVPSEWVRGPLKEHHWRTLCVARAIENTVYIAAADHPPPVGVGSSMIVDPKGVELATLGDETGVTLAWISKDRVDDARAVNPALSLRRFRVMPL